MVVEEKARAEVNAPSPLSGAVSLVAEGRRVSLFPLPPVATFGLLLRSSVRTSDSLAWRTPLLRPVFGYRRPEALDWYGTIIVPLTTR
jgi:hypothetical protein